MEACVNHREAQLMEAPQRIADAICAGRTKVSDDLVLMAVEVRA